LIRYLSVEEFMKHHNSLITVSVLYTLLYVYGQGVHGITEAFRSINLTDTAAGTYTLSWNIQNDTINLELQTNVVGWIGIGWHQQGDNQQGMDRADLWTAIWNDTTGGFNVTDRWSKSIGPPSTDLSVGGTCQDNVMYGSLGNSFQTNFPFPVSIAAFSRKLKTGDTNCDVDIVPGIMTIVWAFGTENLFGYHFENAGNFGIDFFGNYSTGVLTTSTTGYVSGTGRDVNIAIVVGVIFFVLSVSCVVAAVVLRKKKKLYDVSEHASLLS